MKQKKKEVYKTTKKVWSNSVIFPRTLNTFSFFLGLETVECHEPSCKSLQKVVYVFFKFFFQQMSFERNAK